MSPFCPLPFHPSYVNHPSSPSSSNRAGLACTLPSSSPSSHAAMSAVAPPLVRPSTLGCLGWVLDCMVDPSMGCLMGYELHWTRHTWCNDVGSKRCRRMAWRRWIQRSTCDRGKRMVQTWMDGKGNHQEYFDRTLKRIHRDRMAWRTRGLEEDPLQREVARNVLDRLKDCKDKNTEHVVVLGGAGENQANLRRAETSQASNGIERGPSSARC